jgi:hypothetical protein
MFKPKHLICASHYTNKATPVRHWQLKICAFDGEDNNTAIKKDNRVLVTVILATLRHWAPLLQWIKQVTHQVISLMDKTCAEYQHNMFHDVGSGEWLPTSILYSVAGLGMIHSFMFYFHLIFYRYGISHNYSNTGKRTEHLSWHNLQSNIKYN